LIGLWDKLTLKYKDEIKTAPLFEGLKPSQIKTTILLAKVSNYSKGDLIIKKNAINHDLMIILEGKASVLVNGKEITHFKTGDTIGEIAFATGRKRTADVMASSNVTIMRLNEKSLKKNFKSYPKIAKLITLNIAKILGQRLAATTQKL
tara:strand:- start:21 stop:467 length:447 start_codon:yes stop_codon:yes gene_type:complete